MITEDRTGPALRHPSLGRTRHPVPISRSLQVSASLVQRRAPAQSAHHGTGTNALPGNFSAMRPTSEGGTRTRPDHEAGQQPNQAQPQHPSRRSRLPPTQPSPRPGHSTLPLKPDPADADPATRATQAQRFRRSSRTRPTPAQPRRRLRRRHARPGQGRARPGRRWLLAGRPRAVAVAQQPLPGGLCSSGSSARRPLLGGPLLGGPLLGGPLLGGPLLGGPLLGGLSPQRCYSAASPMPARRSSEVSMPWRQTDRAMILVTSTRSLYFSAT